MCACVGLCLQVCIHMTVWGHVIGVQISRKDVSGPSFFYSRARTTRLKDSFFPDSYQNIKLRHALKQEFNVQYKHFSHFILLQVILPSQSPYSCVSIYLQRTSGGVLVLHTTPLVLIFFSYCIFVLWNVVPRGTYRSSAPNCVVWKYNHNKGFQFQDPPTYRLVILCNIVWITLYTGKFYLTFIWKTSKLENKIETDSLNGNEGKSNKIHCDSCCAHGQWNINQFLNAIFPCYVLLGLP